MKVFLLFLAVIIVGNFLEKRWRGSRFKRKNNAILKQKMDFQRQMMEQEAIEQHHRFMEQSQRDMETQQRMNNNF